MIEELDEDEIPPQTPDTKEKVESYRNKVRNMLDLNSDGQEEESDYKPHERA